MKIESASLPTDLPAITQLFSEGRLVVFVIVLRVRRERLLLLFKQALPQTNHRLRISFALAGLLRSAVCDV